MTVTILEPPWEVDTPRGKADAVAMIDYSQESYVYFLTALRGTGDFWVYRNDKVQLWWNESTGAGKKPENNAEKPTVTYAEWTEFPENLKKAQESLSKRENYTDKFTKIYERELKENQANGMGKKSAHESAIAYASLVMSHAKVADAKP